MKTRQQLRKKYRLMCVEREPPYRVQQRGWLGLGWCFVCHGYYRAPVPYEFLTLVGAQAAIARWVEADYRAQRGVWR